MWGLSIIIHKVPFMLGHYITVYILFIVIKNGVLHINYYVGISGIMFWQSQRVLKYLTQNKLKSHCKLLTFSKSAVYKKRSSLGSCLDASRVMAIFVYSGDRKPNESLFLYIYPFPLVDRVVHLRIRLALFQTVVYRPLGKKAWSTPVFNYYCWIRLDRICFKIYIVS